MLGAYSMLVALQESWSLPRIRMCFGRVYGVSLFSQTLRQPSRGLFGDSSMTVKETDS